MHILQKKSRWLFAAAALLLAVSLTACGTPKEGPKEVGRPVVTSPEPQFQAPAAGQMIAVFETSAGTFKAMLYPDKAPMACENFAAMAEAGYYDGMPFARIEPGFVVEAGTPAVGRVETLWEGHGYPAEPTDALRHYSGALCMALNTNNRCTSVFYLMQTAPDSVDDALKTKMSEAGWRQEVQDTYAAAGGAPYLDYTDTVFGQVYEGMEVVDRLAAAQTGAGEGEMPVIHSVVLQTAE